MSKHKEASGTSVPTPFSTGSSFLTSGWSFSWPVCVLQQVSPLPLPQFYHFSFGVRVRWYASFSPLFSTEVVMCHIGHGCPWLISETKYPFSVNISSSFSRWRAHGPCDFCSIENKTCMVQISALFLVLLWASSSTSRMAGPQDCACICVHEYDKLPVTPPCWWEHGWILASDFCSSTSQTFSDAQTFWGSGSLNVSALCLPWWISLLDFALIGSHQLD